MLLNNIPYANVNCMNIDISQQWAEGGGGLLIQSVAMD
jgi:hypothetical protein